jgi:hypothetical protein
MELAAPDVSGAFKTRDIGSAPPLARWAPLSAARTVTATVLVAYSRAQGLRIHEALTVT